MTDPEHYDLTTSPTHLVEWGVLLVVHQRAVKKGGESVHHLSRTAQRLSLVVLPMPLDRRHPAGTPAQGVIVPACRRGVCATHR